MRLEDQVASLELCKRLKELNVKQESYFYWPKNGEAFVGPSWVFDSEEMIECSAFTVAELGEMLPYRCKSYADKEGSFFWSCEWEDKDGYVSKSGADTEADARAKMLIHLIERGLLNPKSGE